MPTSFSAAVMLVLWLLGGLAAAPMLAQSEPDTTTTADVSGQESLSEDTLSEDDDLARRMQAVLSRLEGFERVQADVTEGVVRLTGTVVRAEQSEEAAALAAAFPGVLYVINDLETDVEVEARVSPAFERLQTYITDAIAYLPVVAVALVVLLLFWFLASLAGRLQSLFTRFGTPPLIANLMARILRFVVFVVGLVLVLDILGITALVGAILGTAGIVGIAVGFAFQDIIENYLAGLLLSVRRPFALGDHVVVSGEEGKVVRLTARELILMTLDGNHVSIPNASVFKSTIYNFTRNPRRRFSFEVGVDVEEELSDVQQLGVDVLHQMPGVMETPRPFARVTSLGDSNVVVTFFGWVDQTQFDFSKVTSEAIRLVKAAMDDTGIVMPEPIYIVKMFSSEPTPAEEAALKDTKKSKLDVTAVVREVSEADVAVDSDLDDQIREDLAASDEPNLLEPS